MSTRSESGKNLEPETSYETLATSPCTCNDGEVFCRPCSVRLVLSMQKVTSELAYMMERLGVEVKTPVRKDME